MLFLFLAILSSAGVSIAMRASANKVRGDFGVLVVNYLLCSVFAAVDAFSVPMQETGALGFTVPMGIVNGFFYLGGLLLFQYSVKKCGVVLTATFSKLGLLIPILLSVLLFGEVPGVLQIIGVALAIGAIVLVNFEKSGEKTGTPILLLILLLMGGCGDTLAKVFEQYGETSHSAAFLALTFTTALLLSGAMLIIRKQPIGKWEILFGLLVGIPNFFSAKFLLAALGSIDAIIAYPTYNAATILLVTLAGLFFFRERLKTKQWVALGAITAALILLNI